MRSASDRVGDCRAGLDASRVLVEPPRDPAMGEIATNAAMVLAKEAQQEPARHRRADAADLAARSAVS